MIKSLFYLAIAAMIPAVAFVACSSEIMTLPMDVSLDKNAITLSPGDSISLIADLIPDEAISAPLSWNSSNLNVATVNNGVVTAIAEGEATITVSITTRIGEKKKSCQVTVSYPVRSITINKSAGYLSVGDTLVLTAEVAPDDAPDKSFVLSQNTLTFFRVNNCHIFTFVSIETMRFFRHERL